MTAMRTEKRKAAARRAPIAAPAPTMKIANDLLGGDAYPSSVPVHGYRSYPLQRPRLPFTIPPTMAMDDGGGGAYPLGAFLGAGGSVSSFNLHFPGYAYLSELSQRSEFRNPTETTARELTRKWITFKSKGEGDKSDKIGELEDAFTAFDVQGCVRRACEHDGFYGLGHVFISLKGHENALADPLVIDAIDQDTLQGFLNIEPMWVTPLVWNSNDPTQPDFYKPVAWIALGKKMHGTRLLRFLSRELPDILKPAYNFGGMSLSQLIEPYVNRWLKTVDSVNRLISNFSTLALGTDMAAVLGGGSNSELLKRLRLFTRDRDNQGIFCHDFEKEKLEQLAAPLSGLAELQQQALEHMAYPTHLPLVVLTGVTPSGLNASSEGDIEIYHDWIHSGQEGLIRPRLDVMFKVIQRHLWGEVDEDIIYDFVPLKEVTGEALSRVKKTQAEMDQIYIDAGVVAREEVRERIANDPDSGYNNLDANAELPELPEEEGDGQGGGDEDVQD